MIFAHHTFFATSVTLWADGLPECIAHACPPPPTVPLMAGRLLKVSSLATAVFASSGFYLYNRQLDLNDLSVIRFGRAALTVSYCTLLPWQSWCGDCGFDATGYFRGSLCLFRSFCMTFKLFALWGLYLERRSCGLGSFVWLTRTLALGSTWPQIKTCQQLTTDQWHQSSLEQNLIFLY